VHGWGLRGGTYRFSGPPRRTRITFHGYKWTTDTAVSGYALWNRRNGHMQAWLKVSGPGGSKAHVYLSYEDNVYQDVAMISGSFAGHSIRAQMPPP
jgi:hypothetical protein